MTRTMSAWVCATVVSAWTLVAGAGEVTDTVLPGALDAGSPRMDRVRDSEANTAACTAVAPDSYNDDVPYAVYALDTPVTTTLVARVDGNIDSFLALYCAGFDPAQPGAALTAVDDDGAGYPNAGFAAARGITLQANTRYFLVVASYSSSATALHGPHGTFQLTVGSGVSVAPDADADGLGDDDDLDDDNDGVDDAQDVAPFDRFRCSDTDADTCDDCASGTVAPGTDGPDLDADGTCDASDVDRDGDGAENAADSHPDDRMRCGDFDGDTCEDCVSGSANPSADGDDFDGDGRCDLGDPDDDDDGVNDEADGFPYAVLMCRDDDIDTCDDCSRGRYAPANDGPDFDGDGACDDGDFDDDGDGASDELDNDDRNNHACSDFDEDTCDDCSPGTFTLIDDGTDTDGDGACDDGDLDDDDDGVSDESDRNRLDAGACSDVDQDTCDDCEVHRTFAPSSDGPDFDGDGACDRGDGDDDNDGRNDDDDPNDNDAAVCGDFDQDTCDDCEVARAVAPGADGDDLDGDGACDRGDPDDDGDGVADGDDANARDRHVCGDGDRDTCDDCVSGTVAPDRDGPDLDGDMACDDGDADDDGDSVDDASDADPRNRFVCRDADRDQCEDCASGRDAPGADGHDLDADGLCDLGDPDDDGDNVGDAVDLCPRVFDPTQGDRDGDGRGDACDPDRDGDGVPDERDNCPDAPNAGQFDADRDGRGDACDDTPGCVGPIAQMGPECFATSLPATVLVRIQAQLVNPSATGRFPVRLTLVDPHDPARRFKLAAVQVSPTGKSRTVFARAPIGNWDVIATHGNHLAVRTAAPVAIGPQAREIVVDLAQPSGLRGQAPLLCRTGRGCALRAGDLDQDGDVDAVDRAALFAALGRNVAVADLNGDFIVDMRDADLQKVNLGQVSGAR